MKHLVRLFGVAVLTMILGACAIRSGTWPAVIEPEPKHSRLDAIEWQDGIQSWQPSLTADGEPMPVALPEAWIYEKRSLVFRLKALPELNVYKDKSHALLVYIYLMSTPSAFTGLLATPDGRQNLLNGKVMDPSILSKKQIFLQPGKSETVVLDRDETAQYFGVIAGYYELDPKLISRTVPIPAVQDKPVGKLALIKEKIDVINPLAKPPPLPRPARMKVWLDFGAKQIELMDMRAM